MVVGHVEVQLAEHGLDGVHVGGGAAAEDLALAEVRCHQLQHAAVEVAAEAGPGLAVLGAFAHQVQGEVVDPCGHVLQLTLVDDVARGAGAVHEDHVDAGIGVVEPARHGHHRGDTDAAGEVEHLVGGIVDGVEQADRPVHGQVVANLEVVVQPVGHLAARHALDRDGEAVGHRGRTGDGVGTHHLPAVDLQLQGHELARLEEVHQRDFGREAEGAHVPGFLDDLDAAHGVAAIGPGLSGYGVEEGIHDAPRLPLGLLAAILGGPHDRHFPNRDIHMPMATGPAMARAGAS